MKPMPLLALIESQMPIRCRNALASGATTMLILVGVISLFAAISWSAGRPFGQAVEWVSKVLSGDVGVMCVVIAFMAFLVGGCLSARAVFWSLLVGLKFGCLGVVLLFLVALGSAG